MNLITKILKESEEENLVPNPERLFRPRKVEDRLSKVDSKSRRFMSLSNNQIIDVLIWNYNKFVKGKINGDPDPDYDTSGNWIIRVYLDIPKEIVKPGDGYGIYLTSFVNFNEEKNCWITYIDPSTEHNYQWYKLEGIK